jgi:hypothetical protein
MTLSQLFQLFSKGPPEMTTHKRVSQFTVKVILAVVLTLAATVGSGVVAGQMGIEHGPAVYACTASGGGGC